MNIYEYQAQFESVMQSTVSLPSAAAEQGWEYFKGLVREPCNEDYCDEVSFWAGMNCHYDGKEMVFDDNFFLISMHRLVDAESPNSWRTAEISCNFLYPMTPELRLWDQQFRPQNSHFDVGFCTDEGEAAVTAKLDVLSAFVDSQQLLWNTLRELKPTEVNVQFLHY